MVDYAKIEISGELPPAGDYTEREHSLFARLVGAKIVACGAPVDADAVEGGGFVIDYIPAGSGAVHRVVFGFTELGMWVEFDGLKDSSP
jgi:hypothetical protein